MKAYFSLLSISVLLFFALVGCSSDSGGSGDFSSNTLAAPKNVVAIPADGQVTLAWDPVVGATSYNIYWSVISNFTQSTGTKISNISSPYVHKPLANTLAYYYIVTAVGPSGEGYASTIVSATPVAATVVPDAPIGVSVTAGDGQNTISWDMVTGATSYDIYYSASPGVTTGDTKIVNVTTPYAHTGLTNGSPYYYVVTATNAIGESALSNEVTATPVAATNPPSAPTGLSATAGDGVVVLNWNTVAEATSYNVYYSTISGVTRDNGTKVSDVTSPFTKSGLVNGTTYYFTVTAVNNVGESSEASQVSATPASTVQQGSWSSLGAGLNNSVNDFAYYNGVLHAASYGVASWDGNAWTDTSDGLTALFGSGDVYTIAPYGTDFFAGGSFTVFTPDGNWYNNAARYGSGSWTTCGTGIGSDGSGMSSHVNDMLQYNGQLYAGGAFGTAGGEPWYETVASRIASFYDGVWHQVGGGLNDTVTDMLIFDGDLIVSGYFTTANYLTADGSDYSSSPITVNYIARWDGMSWSAFGSGMNGKVTALAIHNGQLYAGGQFTTAGGVPVENVAKWNGTSWSAVGDGISSQVYTLASYNGKLYAGGQITYSGATPVSYIVRWDDSQWSDVDGGTDGPVITLLPDNSGGLLVGGNFSSAGGVSASNVARYFIP